METIKEDGIFIVTGASSGIGKAVALKINRLGGKVIAIARNQEKLKITKSCCKYPEHFFIEARNLAEKIDLLSGWILEVSRRYGKLKGLVLSAGIQQTIPLKVLDIAEAKKLFDINYFSNLALAKGFCDRRVNIAKGSSIVFISSILSITGGAGTINYSASKGAINSVVRAMAVEVARQGIRVNAVLPGLVLTKMIEEWTEVYGKEYIDELIKKCPLGMGQPEDVADSTCFLLSNNAKWITGQCFVVDGGVSLT